MNNDLIHRMKSIKQTVQISNAQKLVAAAQIGRIRRLQLESKPYHDRVTRAIAEMLRQCPEVSSRYINRSASDTAKRGLLVLAANRGLAGGFNSNVVHFTEALVTDKNYSYMMILGNSCKNYFVKKSYPVDEDFVEPLDPPTLFTAREIAEKVIGMFQRYEVDSFDVIYTKYYSPVRMDVTVDPLFPIDPSMFKPLAEAKYFADFEPSPTHVFDSMFVKYTKGFLYGCLVNTCICELTSRITAMDSAIRNGNEILDKLALMYNRARQAAITQEITEIVASAAALGDD